MVANLFLREYRDSILSIAQSHGMSHVRVFGSMARNADTANSDIDLLVKIDPECSLLDIIDAKYEIEDLTGRRVDIVTEAALSPYLKTEVLQSAVELRAEILLTYSIFCSVFEKLNPMPKSAKRCS